MNKILFKTVDSMLWVVLTIMMFTFGFTSAYWYESTW
jgi:hypothetical protein